MGAALAVRFLAGQTPKLAAMFGVGVALTWDREGHTAYPETRCITAAVNGA